jgi:hypothetical protein
VLTEGRTENGCSALPLSALVHLVLGFLGIIVTSGFVLLLDRRLGIGWWDVDYHGAWFFLVCN